MWSLRKTQLAHMLRFAPLSLLSWKQSPQPRAPTLTFRTKDKTLHDGALAEEITRIGWGWGRLCPGPLHPASRLVQHAGISHKQLCAPVLAPPSRDPWSRAPR